jgi:hypothetical protein
VDDISLEFENTLSDHLHAERVYYSHGILTKVDKAVAAVLTASGIAMLAVFGARWWCFVPFPLAIAEWFDLFSIRPLQIRMYFKSNPKFRERYHLRFAEDGIHFKTTSIDSTLSWGHYSRFLEGDRVFLLVYGKQMYTVIPKSAFKDATRIDHFRSMVKAKLVTENATDSGRQPKEG